MTVKTMGTISTVITDIPKQQVGTETVVISTSGPRVREYRYERKVPVNTLSIQKLEMMIKVHPAHFRPIFVPRTINNIYLDTPQYDHYFDNVNGNSERLKVRIRWYGNDAYNIAKPVLEFKHKNGLIGYKRSFDLAPFLINQTQTLKDQVSNALNTSNLPASVKWQTSGLQPTVTNRYRRQYFLSGCKRFRLTLDNELSYGTTGKQVGDNRYPYHSAHKVIEIKYAVPDDVDACQITSKFPFSIYKFSKYVQGFNVINGLGNV